MAQGVHQSERMALGLAHGDVAELSARAGDDVARDRIGLVLQADAVERPHGPGAVARRDVGDHDPLVVRRAECAVAEPIGQVGQAVELLVRQPAQRDRHPQRQEARLLLGEPADEILLLVDLRDLRIGRLERLAQTRLDATQELLDPDLLDEVPQPGLVAFLARTMVAEDVQRVKQDVGCLVLADPRRHLPGQVRVLALGPGQEPMERDRSIVAPGGDEAGVLRPAMQRRDGSAIHGHVELAGQVRQHAIVEEHVRQAAAERADIHQLSRVEARPGMRHHVADVVVPRLLRRQPDRLEPADHLRQVVDVQPLHLEVPARRHVDDAIAVARDHRDHLRLLGRHLAAGDADPDHVPAVLDPLAVEGPIPLHPLKVRVGDLRHRGPRPRVGLDVGPHIEPVLLRLPGFDFGNRSQSGITGIRQPRPLVDSLARGRGSLGHREPPRNRMSGSPAHSAPAGGRWLPPSASAPRTGSPPRYRFPR